MSKFVSDIAFSPAVKAEQERRGSRALYEKMERTKGWRSVVTPDFATAIAETRSFYLGTASAAGQPYIQHRGGPPGFLRVVDERTLGFADFTGNRQYITAGNLSENPHAYIFIMDYVRCRRVKIWGTAKIIENDDDLLSSLQPEGGNAIIEWAILFEIHAWDRNCPQHIPQRLEAADVTAALAERDNRIATLEADIQHLRAKLSAPNFT